ncbi:MAG TPA: response regulator transcription factor [Gemmatimonadales bacterium]|nr:response regulator transcription factor [Gemmatimonadales bacterium]
MAEAPLRVLLADDHALVRAGLRALLNDLPGVEVVAETGDGREALRLVREQKPDIAMIDISMPGLNGLDVAARIAHDRPATRVIIVSMHGDDETVRRALTAGATGYLLKNSDRGELEMALRTVARGDTWLSPALTKRVVAVFTQDARPAEGGGPFAALTPRQREVLQLVAEGHSNKEIAQRLNVALKTVETHRTELMERLDIHGVAGLVRYAIQVGLVRPES